jgi:subtilisin family serine protease
VIGRVLDDRLYWWESEVLEAIDWATLPAQGARIVCLSLASPRAAGEEFSPHFQATAERLLRETPGALLVASAGNDSDRFLGRVAPVANPAACPAILAVAAITDTCGVARASCGEQDAIGRLAYSAPGVGVHTAARNGGFDRVEGTSFAAPHVVGIAAVQLEKLQTAAGATVDAADLRQELASSVHTLTPSADFGAGIPQAP